MSKKEASILIVDDDDVDVMSIRRALKQAKVANQVYVTKDGVEALAKLRSNEIPLPRIVLMDLNMPRMDGVSCMQEIRADHNLRRTIIFVLTTSKDEEDRIKAYDCNPAGYIVKTEAGDGFLRAVQMLDSYWRVIEFPDS